MLEPEEMSQTEPNAPLQIGLQQKTAQLLHGQRSKFLPKPCAPGTPHQVVPGGARDLGGVRRGIPKAFGDWSAGCYPGATLQLQLSQAEQRPEAARSGSPCLNCTASASELYGLAGAVSPFQKMGLGCGIADSGRVG